MQRKGTHERKDNDANSHAFQLSSKGIKTFDEFDFDDRIRKVCLTINSIEKSNPLALLLAASPIEVQEKNQRVTPG